MLFDQWGHSRPGRTLESGVERVEARCYGKGIPAIFAAEIESKPVGTVSIVKHDMDTRKDLYPWVSSLCVHKDFRHQNIGRTLINFIESYARELDVKRLYLFTPDKQRMYSLLGWTTIEETEYRSKMVTIMKKDFRTI